MLFEEQDSEELKGWLVKRIENTATADADVLGDYLIALLSGDGNEASVREMCEAEIPDFLNEDAKAFTDEVMEVIKHKSYKPGAKPPPPKTKPTTNNGSNVTSNENATSAPITAPTGPSSKKRGYEDYGGPAEGDHQQQFNNRENGRATKQAKRRNKRDGRPAEFQQNGQQHGGGWPMFPAFDPNNPMEGFLAMQQAMGLLPMDPNNPLASLFQQQMPQQGGRGGRKPCRSMQKRGYCPRGLACNFDHTGMGGSGAREVAMNYDDETNDSSNFGNPNQMPAGEAPSFAAEAPRGRGRGRGTQRGRNGRSGGVPRAPYSAEGPNDDPNKKTIVVENIPEESFSEETVREFFSQHGNILEVSMQPYKHLAIIKYDSWDAANAAYTSPKVIFDNRFVKVYWYKDPEENLPESMAMNNGVDAGAFEEEAEPEFDLEEFTRAQQEAQKKFEEREEKRKELENQRLQIARKQEELLSKHLEASERLSSLQRGKTGSNSPDADDEATAETDALRAKLAALESEAKILGIDPDGMDDAASMMSDWPPPRGGYRGRVRGGRGRARGRGRGRGAFRGGAGGVEGQHAAYARYTLDNRPRTIEIKGADFSAPESDEKLRHFLLNLGEFDAIDTTSSSAARVSFPERKTAEKAFHSLNGQELHGVEGLLEVSWVANAGGGGGGSGSVVKGVEAPVVKEQEQGQDDEMEGSEDGEIGGDDDDGGNEEREAERRQMDMDYDAW